MFEPRKVVGHRHPFHRPGWDGVFWDWTQERTARFPYRISYPAGIYFFADVKEARQWEITHQIISRAQPPSMT